MTVEQIRPWIPSWLCLLFGCKWRPVRTRKGRPGQQCSRCYRHVWLA